MKHFGLLMIALTVPMAIGTILASFPGDVEAYGTEGVVLEAGTTSTGHLAVDMLGGGTISGTYASESGRQVLFMALDDDQYEAFLAGGSCDTHISEIAASGEFYVDWPAMEWCHVVIQHAAESDLEEQVTVEYKVTSQDWPVAFTGIGVMGATAVVITMLMFKHQSDRKKMEGEPRYIDVVLFEDQAEK
jgi:hypothetical protein